MRRWALSAGCPLIAFALGCFDAPNVARTDQPAALQAVSDSLDHEHFRGLVVAEVPVDGTLQLRFRDPSRCREPDPALRPFAEAAAARAIAVFRPKLMPHPTTVDRVRVQITRTHRFGVMVWTTALGDFSFPADSLRSVVVKPPVECGFLSPLLKSPNG